MRWASRWDVYLQMTDANIHWFSIINSVVVVLFLTGIITTIIIRTLRRDIARYNNMEDSAEEALEESGWKLLHGDVFRPPRYPRLFASLIGSGIQILGMAVVTICKNTRHSSRQWKASRNSLMSCDFSFRHVGNVISSLQRCPNVRHDIPVRHHGVFCWLPFCKTV